MSREDVDLESVDREKVLIESLSHANAYDHPVRDVRVVAGSASGTNTFESVPPSGPAPSGSSTPTSRGSS